MLLQTVYRLWYRVLRRVATSTSQKKTRTRRACNAVSAGAWISRALYEVRVLPKFPVVVSRLTLARSARRHWSALIAYIVEKRGYFVSVSL